MLIAVSLVCAVLAAASNALGNVMQRRAALIVPRSDRFRIGLMWDLLRTPVWVLGIGGVVLAALFQGAALATGPLAVVQPVFLLELPFTLFVAGIAFRHPMPQRHPPSPRRAVDSGDGLLPGGHGGAVRPRSQAPRGPKSRRLHGSSTGVEICWERSFMCTLRGAWR
ncbi:DMT family protein [Streptomyces olivochromogenes]|uniref:hypothetical protein n=1 Tax=Streptomyces olivochromogenes TaxID=1963 RepID=UPI0036CF4EEC